MRTERRSGADMTGNSSGVKPQISHTALTNKAIGKRSADPAAAHDRIAVVEDDRLPGRNRALRFVKSDQDLVCVHRLNRS